MFRPLTATITAALLAGLLLQGPAPVFAAANDIYVGSAADATAASSCDDPDFSTNVADEGDINSAIDAALTAVDDDEDVVIICDGEYTYADDINVFDANIGDNHSVITIRGENAGDVTLYGITDWQLFNFTNMDSVSISGINFVDAYFDGDGAAVRMSEGGSLSVSDCSFESGFATGAGSAIYSDGGHVTVDGCSFTGNQSDDNDGAIYVDHAPADLGVTVTDSTFTDNTSGGDGAAISVNGADPAALISVTDSTFTNNDGAWGAITIDNGGVNLLRVRMEGNDSEDDGGAVWAGEFLTIAHSTFVDNSADLGGAILSDGDTSIDSSTFRLNSSDSEGGAVYLSNCDSFEITDSVFDRNTSGDSGGAVNNACNPDGVSGIVTGNTFSSNTAGSYGGAMDNDVGAAAVLVYTRNIFRSNVSASTGGALWVDSGIFSKNTFRSNRADGCGGAVRLTGTDHNTLKRSGNRFSSNRGGGSRRTWDVCR